MRLKGVELTLDSSEVSIDQLLRMEDIRRTDTCLVRLFYSAFHHQRLVSVELNHRLIPQITQGRQLGACENVLEGKAHFHAV